MIERKCLNCGTWNTTEDHCTNCRKPISPVEINRAEEKEKRDAELAKPKDAFQLFVEKMANHPNIFMRILYKIGYSVAMVFGAIGAFFAWMVALANG